MKRVAILQSNYIPWKGYFDIIGMVDLFVFHDDLQYTKDDWRNRNKIKTPKGAEWLSIPCGKDEKRLICEVRVDNAPWQKEHWAKISQHYRKAPHWSFYEPWLKEFYHGRKWELLSDLNQDFIVRMSRDFFDFQTEFDDSRKYRLKHAKAERVLELLKHVGATHYLSGPSAKAYLDAGEFKREGIALEWMDYTGYADYSQLFPPFEHSVSIIDLLFNTGPGAKTYLKSLNAPTPA